MRSARRAMSGASVLLAGALGLTACVGDPPTVTPPVATADPGARATGLPGATEWVAEVRNRHTGLGFERVSFDLFDDARQPVRMGTVAVVFYRVLPTTEMTQRVASGEALYFGPQLPGGGSWVAYTEFDSSGPWLMDVNATTGDGRSGQAEVRFEVEGRGDLPIYGQPPPEGDTPSLSGATAIAEITSDRNPLEALYEQSVSEAVGAGRPALVHFGSPLHCDDDDCRAALTEVRVLHSRYAERVNFVHVESRDLSAPDRMSEAASAWGLPNEPWTFIFDSGGFLSSRIEGPISNTELGLLLDRVLGGT